MVVIGVGNAYRRDDGVGLTVARQLRARRPPGCEVLESGGGGAALMELWRRAARVIVVDAVASHAAPGTLHRFDAASSPLPVERFRCSTHAFSVAEAVEMARALGRLPPGLLVYGIEGADFSDGLGLSPAVARAAEALCAQILRELNDA